MGIAIESTDRDSWFIATAAQVFSKEQRKHWIDCGQNDVGTHLSQLTEPLARFNISLSEGATVSETSIRVVFIPQTPGSPYIKVYGWTCVSSGAAERELYEHILSAAGIPAGK